MLWYDIICYGYIYEFYKFTISKFLFQEFSQFVNFTKSFSFTNHFSQNIHSLVQRTFLFMFCFHFIFYLFINVCHDIIERLLTSSFCGSRFPSNRRIVGKNFLFCISHTLFHLLMLCIK